jgi:type II secretory pathway pseudopilin PulG
MHDRLGRVHIQYSRLRDDDGVSLVELMVALTVAVVIMTGIANGLVRALWVSGDSKNREVATNLAAGAIDQARETTNYATLLGSTDVQNVNGMDFTILRTVTPYLSSGSTSPCDGSSSSFIKYKEISVKVTWPTMPSTTDAVRAQTLLAPNVTSFDPTLGNVGAKVVNALGQPVEGILVTLVGGTTNLSQFTDPDGCAFFDSLSAGSYTATATSTGYVASSGADQPSVPATVSSGATTPIIFDYDKQGTFNVQLGDVNYPAPATVPVGIGNSSLLPDGTQSVAGTGASRTVTNIFPFPSGYTVWAGSCTDADPEGKNAVGPYYPSSVRGAAVMASSTNPPTVTPVMAKIRVVVLTASGAAVPGVTPVLTHAGTAPCDFPESFTLGVTNGNGESFASMPWGTWDVTIPGRSLLAAVTPVFSPTTNEIYVEVRVP